MHITISFIMQESVFPMLCLCTVGRQGHRIFFLERNDKKTKGRKKDDVLGSLRQIMSSVYVASYQIP